MPEQTQYIPEEWATGWWAPREAMVSTQEADEADSSAPPESPEKKLMMAVLCDAVEVYAKHDGSAAWKDAHEWIVESRVDYPFSFDNVCYFVGLDPDALREGVIRWSEDQQRGGVA